MACALYDVNGVRLNERVGGPERSPSGRWACATRLYERRLAYGVEDSLRALRLGETVPVGHPTSRRRAAAPRCTAAISRSESISRRVRWPGRGPSGFVEIAPSPIRGELTPLRREGDRAQLGWADLEAQPRW